MLKIFRAWCRGYLVKMGAGLIDKVNNDDSSDQDILVLMQDAWKRTLSLPPPREYEEITKLLGNSRVICVGKPSLNLIFSNYPTLLPEKEATLFVDLAVSNADASKFASAMRELTIAGFVGFYNWFIAIIKSITDYNVRLNFGNYNLSAAPETEMLAKMQQRMRDVFDAFDTSVRPPQSDGPATIIEPVSDQSTISVSVSASARAANQFPKNTTQLRQETVKKLLEMGVSDTQLGYLLHCKDDALADVVERRRAWNSKLGITTAHNDYDKKG